MKVTQYVIILAILLILATACTPQQAPDLASMQAQVQLTLDYDNAVKAALTSAAQAAQPAATATSTQGPPPPTVYVTPNVPMISVSMDTNCREGPDPNIFRSIGGLMVGEKAQIVAKYTKGHWYIIHKPSNPVELCWVYDGYATIEGDTSTLPLKGMPSTPTPKP